MIGRVIAHELRTASRDGRVRGLLVLLLAVLAVAVLIHIIVFRGCSGCLRRPSRGRARSCDGGDCRRR